MPLWNEIEGKTLADGLTLRTLLRSEGRTAWFATTDPQGQPAVVSVFEALNDEHAVQTRLRAASHVQHPNLLTIRGTGSTQVDDESLVYAVMEPFDQTLAEVLRERALTPDEAREVAENLLSALEAVEKAGLHHGHVDAEGVLAVGDAIKLRSDCLTSRPQESDAPALAALLYTALTTRRLNSDRDTLQLPAPFAALVRAGYGPTGSLPAMRRVLSGPPVTSAAAAAAPAVSKTATAPAAKTSPAAAPVTPKAEPRTPVAAPPIPRRELNGEPARPPHRRGVTVAAVVLMAILLVVFWLAFRRPTPHAAVAGQAPTAGTPVNPPPASTAAPEAAAAMGAAAPVHSQEPVRNVPAAAPPAAGPQSATNQGVWHVVVYTYDRESAAQHKASDLAAKYPQLQPQVFSPTGGAPYLVTLGGGADRKEAFARRDAARAAGLPRDTYAQNFRR